MLEDFISCGWQLSPAQLHSERQKIVHYNFTSDHNSVQGRDDNVQQDIIHRITTSLSSNTHTRSHISYLSRNEIPDPFYYNVLFTTHVVFLQRLASSPLDLCCFSLHLCRLSPILTLLFRSLSFSILIVSPLLTLLSFLDFSSVIHLTWSPHVTCDMQRRTASKEFRC